MEIVRSIFSLRTIALLAVAALTTLIYWPGLYGPFLLDDSTNILAAHIEDPNWEAFLYTVTHNASGKLGRIISVMSFMLTEWQYGLSSWGYKFHNLLLHLANGLLLYHILSLLIPALEPKIRQPQVMLTAGITTTFWLLHPLLVSTVLYAVQRMVELAVFFTLVSLICYLHARNITCINRKFFVYGWVLFPATFALAIFSKEIGALIPIYVLVIELLVFKTTVKTLYSGKHISVWLAVFVFLPLTLGCLYLVTHISELTNYGMRNFTLHERLLTQLHVIAYYSRSILLPRISAMSLFQDDFPVTRALDVTTLLLLGLLFTLIASIGLLRKRAPVLAFGIAWFLSSHLLESTIFPLELVFEHRNYIAAVGLLLPCIHYTLQIQKKDLRPLRWFIAVFFVVMIGQTYSRVQEWSNKEVILTVAINDHPSSSRARTEYANYLYSIGKINEAIQQLEVTMGLDPLDAGSVMHQVLLYCLQDERKESLLTEAKTRLSNWPLSVYGLNSINKLMSSVVRGECKQLNLKDIESLLTAGLSQPGNLAIPENHGSLLSFLGLYKFTERKYQQGVALYLQGYELTHNIIYLAQLARYQIRFREFKHAEQMIAKIEELNKDRHGIESYTVTQLSKALASAREQNVAHGKQENL